MILPFKSIETIYGLTYASCYMRMTHVHVQRMCTLLFLSKVLCMCLLEPVGWSTDWLTALVKSSISLLLSGCSIHYYEWGIELANIF